MFERYENFLADLDKRLNKYFDEQSKHICCKKGCSECCEIGDYPFTQQEMMYLMEGFKNLPIEIKTAVKNNLMSIKNNRVSLHLFYKCPFLINNECSVYKYRGITCRTFGLAYMREDGIVSVPECVNNSLCYSNVYNNGELTTEPIKEDLSLLKITNGDLAKKYNLEFGESRSLIDWFP